jgi:hypothetical protein
MDTITQEVTGISLVVILKYSYYTAIKQLEPGVAFHLERSNVILYTLSFLENTFYS